ncbi:tetratricopeptide repeat protein [Nonlabens spongiae]|nr:hypothetical protein [Nonlabens spongiae]
MIELKKLNITNDPSFLSDKSGLDRFGEALLSDIQYDVSKNKRNVFKRIDRAIKKYPNVPQFKNALMSYYMINDDHEKGYKYNRYILKKHPDYPYATINLAAEYVQTGDLDEALDVLGSDFSIAKIFPERTVFHEDEVFAFYHVVACYFLAQNDPGKAEDILDNLKEINGQHFKLEILEEQIFRTTMMMAVDRNILDSDLSDDFEGNYTGEDPDYIPVYHNKEFEEHIYQNDIDAYLPVVNMINDNDFESSDLILPLQHAVKKYPQFSEAFSSDRLGQEHINFHIHAIICLCYYKVPLALKHLLEFIDQDSGFYEFYIGDLGEDIIVPAIVKQTQELDELAEFTCNEGVYTYSRALAGSALVNAPIYGDFSMKTVESSVAKVLDFYISIEEAEIVDRDFLGLFVSNLVDVNLKSRLDKIKKLYDQGKVSKGIAGTYQEVEEDTNYGTSQNYHKPLPNSLEEFYKSINKKWNW